MYNIGLLDPSPMADFDRVVSHRSSATQSQLAPVRPAVGTAYSDYAGRGQAAETLTPIAVPDGIGDVLKVNFRKLDSGQPCHDIRMEILSRTEGGQCPYCRLEDATSLDHIVERSKCPEFSVLRANLAPCCLRCNTTKQHNATKHVGDPTLHLFFNGFPDSDFLQVTFDYSTGHTRFLYDIVQAPGVSADHFHRLTTHFNQLDLGSRYARRARVEMLDRRHELQRLQRNGGPSAVAGYLSRSASSVAANWSEQDWLHVLLATAATDGTFCDQGVLLI